MLRKKIRKSDLQEKTISKYKQNLGKNIELFIEFLQHNKGDGPLGIFMAIVIIFFCSVFC